MKTRRLVTRVAAVCAFAWVVVLSAQTPQVSAGNAEFVGRWEIQVHPPSDASAPFVNGDIPMAIVEIKNTSGTLTATVIDTMGSPMMSGKVTDVSAKDSQISISLDMTVLGQTTSMKFQGKRVGDHLEGSATVPDDSQSVPWIGKPTTSDKVSTPAFAAGPGNQSDDQKAFNEAMRKSSTADRRDALKKFIDDFPSSRLKEQAEYRITQTFGNSEEREAAQLQFAKDHPKSPYTSDLYYSLWQSYLAAKPVDEAKLNAAIDGFIDASPWPASVASGGVQYNPRASAMNTVADRLMTAEVALDKALDLITKAVELAGDKESSTTRA